MDDSNQRIEKLREQLKSANQKIYVLSRPTSTDDTSAKGDLVVQLRQALELNEQKGSQIEESQSQISSLHTKVTQLETSLSAKEQELIAADIKYKKCLEKAKEVIKTMDPRAMHGNNDFKSNLYRYFIKNILIFCRSCTFGKTTRARH